MRVSSLLALVTAAAVAFFAGALPNSAKEANCFGREYPAKAIVVFARSAELEIDLGFGMTYRGIVELDSTVEPAKPVEEWYGKASEALRSKIGGKPITLCVDNTESKSATFYVDGENINRWMIKGGYLPSRIFKENITTKF
jgi:hypothetical protein